MEKIDDSAPDVPSFDAPVPLVAEKLVDEAREGYGQDRGPDPRGFPCQRCRQVGLASGRGNCRKRQQLVAPFSDVLEAFVLQETVDIPQLQFIDQPSP